MGNAPLYAGSRPVTATKVHGEVPGLRIASGNQAPSLAPRTVNSGAPEKTLNVEACPEAGDCVVVSLGEEVPLGCRATLPGSDGGAGRWCRLGLPGSRFRTER